MERIQPKNDQAYRDKNGKYLNKNDVVKKDGVEYVMDEIVEPLMLAHVYDGAGEGHYFIPAELEKEEYVV